MRCLAESANLDNISAGAEQWTKSDQCSAVIGAGLIVWSEHKVYYVETSPIM